MAAITASLVALAACSGSGGDDAGRGTTTTSTTDDTDARAWATCVSEAEGYRIDHPAEWSTNDGDVMPPCSLFDPDPIEVPEQTQIPTDIAVAVTVEPVSAPAGGGLGERVLSERDTTVDGRAATRVEVEATGEGLFPAGLRTTRWSIDAGDGRIVARTHDEGSLAYEEKQDVLDEMVASLVVLDDEAGEVDDGESSTAPVGEPRTEAIASDDFPAGFEGETAYLVDVRLAPHEGFDRVVFELRGDDVPAYRVRPVDPPIRQAGSGHEVDVEGEAHLELTAQPASGVDLRGDDGYEETYTGADRLPLPDGNIVREVVLTGDYEATLSWVVGLAEDAPFAVAVLRDPLRIVIDVVPDGGSR